MQDLQSSAEGLRDLTCGPDAPLVWGEGNLSAPVAFVGEAPGAHEEAARRPFVGPAGQILARELDLAGIARDKAYITNVVKRRPTRTLGTLRSNRTPSEGEARAWREVLNRELEIVGPSILVCLGAVAASALIHPGFAISAERGRWFRGLLGARAIATFHPAYLLRRGQHREALLEFRQDLNSVAQAVREL